MRRNLVFFSIVWAMVLMISASCATKNGLIIREAAWLGPTVSNVSITPAAGPYYVGDNITVAVTATAANVSPGTLTYAWTLTGTWGTITAGAATDEATISLDAVGTGVTGKVAVTETVGVAPDEQAKTVEKTFTLTVAAPLNAAPVIAGLTATGNALAATFSDADGDALTVDWASTAGTVTPGASSNTAADATFNPPAGETGTSTITLTVADAFADDTATVDISYVAGLPPLAEDTIALYAPLTTAGAGDSIYIFVYANVATDKPLGNLNVVRLLTTNTQLSAQDSGTMSVSNFAVNPLFLNDFGESMAGDDSDGGDAIYAAYSSFDIWGGFADQLGADGTLGTTDDVILFPALVVQQPTFCDIGVNWGNNALTTDDEGVLFVAKYRTLATGTITIDGATDRTFYSDLATPSNTYNFANIGPAVSITVG